ncbi:hypothetical protein SAMN02745157_3690 [Kaistia soli DSM 19436]|uniref:Uncharacterized protein n=1 Tax=Kaistia soli DSM 19436 TaxID=1122133 RepID=A0A1M5I013_9HYPH|nr:hypothetical protein [Kaistia soli]SHG21601.1 hypothetical protein SAMN02745157_3690 [Kaistia soli DSM 19436]
MDINLTIDGGDQGRVSAEPRATGNMPAKKLSDTALVLLNAAANRDNGMMLPVPDGLKARGSALTALLTSLLSRELVEEVAVKTEVESWRGDENSSWIGLRLAPAGLAAIGIEPISDGGDAATAPVDADMEKPQRRPRSRTRSSLCCRVRTVPRSRC